MNFVRSIAEARAERAGSDELALVPTMGALHAGHLSLIGLAKRHAKTVAVSIFVNPTQFGPREDYTKYPRPVEQDLAACEQAGVDWVFLPEADEMYPPGSAEVVLDLPQLSTVLEGKHRPGHFRGVCVVVAKLFNIVRPTVAVFGQKDYQQLRIITAMVEAMNWTIQIVPGPTVREHDGLAMSSRNQFLSETDRQKGLAISRALFLAKGEYTQGVRQTNRLLTSMQRTLLEQHLSIDYVAAVDPVTLKPVEVVSAPTVLAVAARVGTTRLIDNIVIGG
ncbi:MAG TPA: pantoate--beta-alanine ligase [Tepidisphaeraceae bacterium]|jgi:pantoate--beta-alanine ligase|nr:pantoate--beta-alanine ligase [Tepidisphaeraceae bacterium]